MAGNNYRQFHSVDDEAAEHVAHSTDAETSQGPLHDARAPLLEFQHQAGQHCHISQHSKPTPHINILGDEIHPSQTPDTPRNNQYLLSDYDISNSTAAVEIRYDELGNVLQSPVLDQSAEHTHPMWTDFCFSPLCLIFLSVLLALIIAALEISYYISQQNQGLLTASEDMHYVWTYGPTLVLTIIAALWGQLEQRARQMMPWCLMRSGEVSAQNSLMLNYITSSTLGSLARSFKRKHFLVTIGICGSLILRLMIVFASGLVRLEYRSMTHGRDLVIEDIFDLAKHVDYPQTENVLPVTIALNYWAILKYGLTYPHGTTSQFAVQSFASGNDEVYDQLTGEVLVFESSLENCWPFSFTYDYRELIDPELGAFAIPLEEAVPASLMEDLRPWCYASHNNYGRTDSVADGLFHEFLNLTQLIYKCTNSTSVEDQEHRILLTLEYQLSNESEASGIMCEPNYSLTRRVVTNNTQTVGVQDDLKITSAITERLNIGIKPFTITDKIVNSLGGEDGNDLLDFEWNIWYTLLNLTQPQSNLWSFRNETLVVELSQRMWNGLAAYVIKHDYTSPSNETINGTSTSIQGRLCVQELSLRLVEAQMTLLLALIVVLYFLRPGGFYRDPTFLGAHAMILARSPRLMGFLQGYGDASKRDLQASLSGCLASLPQNLPPASPTIILNQHRESSKATPEEPKPDQRTTRNWWSPASVRWWFRICLIALILAAVIALEVLLQISDRDNGLGDFNHNGYLKYTWEFLPSLAMVLLGLLFSMVDSTARILHPFQLLRKGRATMRDMFYDPAREVSLMTVCHAAWKRHFVLLWATLPGLLAPILTIITSGLYTVNPVPWYYNTELNLRDWFRPENRTVYGVTNWVEGDSDKNDEAWTIFKLIQFSNMSYPQWTQGEYALASFWPDNLRSRDGNETSLYITARVPAIRANLNCSLTGKYGSNTYLTTKQSGSQYWIPVDPRPLGCHTPPEWNSTTGQRDLYLSSGNYKNLDGTQDKSRGYYLALLEDDYDNLVMYRDHQMPPDPMTSIRVCGDARQHYFIGLVYGTEAASVLHCVPYVEAAWVTATFALPDLTLVTDVPITPDRASSLFLSDSASMTAFPSHNWEDIVAAVVNGSAGVGLLTGQPPGLGENDTRRLITAVESTLAEYLALNLHFYYRQPVGENDNNISASSAGRNLLTPDGQPATGTVTDRTRLRVKQNEVSTRILQGLLGVMGACLVASTALGRGARVIPRDPGSIASKMAYFADGEIWRRVPVGADRWTDEQIKKHGLGISGGRLLLDWWGDDREDSGDGTRGNKFTVDSADRKEMS